MDDQVDTLFNEYKLESDQIRANLYRQIGATLDGFDNAVHRFLRRSLQLPVPSTAPETLNPNSLPSIEEDLQGVQQSCRRQINNAIASCFDAQPNVVTSSASVDGSNDPPAVPSTSTVPSAQSGGDDEENSVSTK